MKTKIAFAIAMLILSGAWIARADNIQLKDGTQVQGIIKKMEKGKVYIEISAETKIFDLPDVTGMDFDTPHLLVGTPRLPAEHFTARMEADEMIGHFNAVEKDAAEIRRLIDQTSKDWSSRKTIAASDVPQWDAAKESFRAPLSRYQEDLNDLYFHVLGKVDEYNTLTKDANRIYVGVAGIFNVGSPLVSKDLEKLPLKDYVPGNWYDTIFYEGYDRGFRDATERTEKEPYSAYKLD